MQHARQRVLLAAFWFAVAGSVVLALLPHPPQTGIADDKVQHVLAFATLSLLMSLGFEQWSLAARFFAMAALGGGIELLQLFPQLQRDAEWGDWFADCAASAVGLAIHARLGVGTGAASSDENSE